MTGNKVIYFYSQAYYRRYSLVFETFEQLTKVGYFMVG